MKFMVIWKGFKYWWIIHHFLCYVFSLPFKATSIRSPFFFHLSKVWPARSPNCVSPQQQQQGSWSIRASFKVWTVPRVHLGYYFLQVGIHLGSRYVECRSSSKQGSLSAEVHVRGGFDKADQGVHLPDGIPCCSRRPASGLSPRQPTPT